MAEVMHIVGSRLTKVAVATAALRESSIELQFRCEERDRDWPCVFTNIGLPVGQEGDFTFATKCLTPTPDWALVAEDAIFVVIDEARIVVGSIGNHQ